MPEGWTEPHAGGCLADGHPHGDQCDIACPTCRQRSAVAAVGDGHVGIPPMPFKRGEREVSAADLDAQIDALHGPGASAALDKALADGSVFGEADERETDPLWSDLYQQVQVEVTLPDNMRLLLLPDQRVPGGRWYYQIECDRPDTDTGVMGTGRGGKAYLTPEMVAGELMQVAWGLFQAYVVHEAREAFKWRGRRVFGPHIDPEALWEIAERTTYRTRS